MQSLLRAACPSIRASYVALAMLALASPSAWAARVDFTAAEASSTRGDRDAGNAIDRNKKTYWEADDHGSVLTAHFKDCYRVDDIVIDWYGTNDYTYAVALSKDGGKSWKTVVKKKTGSGNDDDSQVDDQTANAIRIVADKDTRLRVNELIVNVLRKTGSCHESGGTVTVGSGSGPGGGSSLGGSTAVGGGGSGSGSGGGVSVGGGGSSGSGASGSGGGTSNAGTSPGGSSSGAKPGGKPADLASVEHLAKWKIALPVPPWGADMNKAKEVKQPALRTFEDKNYFALTDKGDAILFTSIAGGARTSRNTAYARSELRQMKGDGTQEADWACISTDSGFTVRQRLTKTTTNEQPNATIAQIHDAENDVLMVKYFGPDKGANGTGDTGRLEARFNNDTRNEVLDTAYKLGDMMTVEVSTSGGYMTVKYVNHRSDKSATSSAVRMTGIRGGCYFKAGLYIQSCSVKDISGATNEVCRNKGLSAGRYVQDPLESSQLEVYSLKLRNPQ